MIEVNEMAIVQWQQRAVSDSDFENVLNYFIKCGIINPDI